MARAPRLGRDLGLGRRRGSQRILILLRQPFRVLADNFDQRLEGVESPQLQQVPLICGQNRSIVAGEEWLDRSQIGLRAPMREKCLKHWVLLEPSLRACLASVMLALHASVHQKPCRGPTRQQRPRTRLQGGRLTFQDHMLRRGRANKTKSGRNDAVRQARPSPGGRPVGCPPRPPPESGWRRSRPR